MYWHSKSKHIEEGVGAYSQSNPKFRRAFGEMQEQVQKLSPREMSPVRRFEIKKMRFQGKLPELVARSAAVRYAMSREVNR